MTAGRIVYEGYYAFLDGRTTEGRYPMPSWLELSLREREAFENGADCLLNFKLGELEKNRREELGLTG